MTELDLLTPDLAAPHTLLAVADDVDPAELEALALSLDLGAGWEAPGLLRLTPGASLTGPWLVDTNTRMTLELPAWTTQAYLLRCPPNRGKPMPKELQGTDPLMELFLDGLPSGDELVAVSALRKIARRLGGAIRVGPSGGIYVPDPDSAVNLTVLAPVALDEAAALTVLRPILPDLTPIDDLPVVSPAPRSASATARRDNQIARVRENLGLDEGQRRWLDAESAAFDEAASRSPMVRIGYALRTPGRDGIEVAMTGVDSPIPAIAGEPWIKNGIVSYTVRWRPADYTMVGNVRVPRAVRRTRMAVTDQIEAAARAIVAVTEGRVVDDDGFLVEL
ncbi:hypothetical protein [Buchananella hordeovulneris]|uniref:Uncharacterized protein n=1 Tax=Buchananella hordeovulneris TaxID=52770 RepID=A0A1Q5PUW1_9ACTO|nr:hypothetical protein [Buchananella hordeovulneris]MDO5080268.1 PRTRC system protein E [Buchananella hordeovulneris]OKL51215.1 hypothetical protein BSZ40_09050 [Buchananella hordeovulneris]RRD44388.1 PRTRC system protein E [Buchananella hordeovulneris]RRD51636.1 PRTRC system protein E [Buchananella hordeovulneris]